MQANNFAMKDWHLEHVEKVIVRFVKGISPDASSFEKRNYKKYSTVTSCAKQIEYDIKHGAAIEQVLSMFHKVRNESSFSELRKGPGSMERLAEVEGHFTKPKATEFQWR